jgi:tetratricopeptide (TPR) repeat protein
MSDEPSSSYNANLLRGQQLRDMRRYPDAEKYLQQAIGEQPNNAAGYYQLAFCYCNWDDHEKKALQTIDRAISLDPNQADFFALRAWILGNLDRDKEAIQVAGQALELDPFEIMALNAQSRAYIALQMWKEAETTARHVLELNARNDVAGNFLAIALRQQGRRKESEAISAALLAQVPDDAMSQCNAGWSALEGSDYRRANRHFLEALRLNPNYDSARRGLLHSFNSRVWIYRVYFQFVAWLGKHRKETRYFFLIVIYVAYRLVVSELRTFGKEGVNWGFVVVALYLVIFGFGKSFGNLFLLLDPFARHALKRKEIGWSLFAGTLYGFFLYAFFVREAWPQLAFLSAILLFFLWGVLSARIQEAFAKESTVNISTEH